MMQTCFVNTDQLPVKIQHICYFTRSDGEEISLCETFREYYPHPDAPEDALVDVVRTTVVHTYKRQEARAANIVLLEAAQKSCKNHQHPL